MDDEQQPVGGITVEPATDGSLVTMWGDVDASLRDQASASMAQVVGRGGPVVIDLAEVTFIDSSGLAFILQLHRLGNEERSQQLTLRNPPTIVLDLLEMVGLDGQVPLDFTPGDAEVGRDRSVATDHDLNPAPVS